MEQKNYYYAIQKVFEPVADCNRSSRLTSGKSAISIEISRNSISSFSKTTVTNRKQRFIFQTPNI